MIYAASIAASMFCIVMGLFFLWVFDFEEEDLNFWQYRSICIAIGIGLVVSGLLLFYHGASGVMR